MVIGSLAAQGQAPDDEERKYRRAATLKGLAVAEMEEGNYDVAAGYLEEIAELLPENLLPPLNLAICHFQTGRHNEAHRQVDKARRLAPSNPRVLYTLARILEREGADEPLWREVLERFAAAHPFDPRPLFLHARGLALRQRFADAVPLLAGAVDLEPENLVLLLELLVAAGSAGLVEETADALDAVDDRLGGFDATAEPFAMRLRRSLAAGESDALRVPCRVLQNVLRPTQPYQAGLDPLIGRRATIPQLFPQLDFDPPLPQSPRAGQDIAFVFTDATASSGLAQLPPPERIAPARVPGVDDWLYLSDGKVRRVSWSQGAFSARELAVEPAARGFVLSFDVDQDQSSDLIAADADAGIRLYTGVAGGGWRRGVPVLVPLASAGLASVYALDLDHEGDLDLFVARRGHADLYLQNNGEGNWLERAGELGLAGGERDTTAVATADFDDDGDLDLVICHGDALRLYLNQRSGPFLDASARYGVDGVRKARGARAADLDNDGLVDLLLWGETGGVLLVNHQRRAFRPRVLPEPMAGTPWLGAAVADFDNDGDLDVVAALETGAVFARNRNGSFEIDDVGLPAAAVRTLEAGDFDDDGDLDLLALGDKGALFWRNDGGNRNHWLRLTLRGKNDNNAKNNTQGLYARIEARVAGSYQAILGNGGVNHLGLGAEREAEVIRVVWTNGLPQTWRRVAGDRTLVEEQVLKGSCPFLYTWDGETFVFHTDLMWRSPLGMITDDGRAAPHQSARDYVLIPGAALRPSGGELWLQITGELWEAVYLDRIELLAVDHPAAAELVVDEKLTPPPYPREAPLHWLGERLAPAAASDHAGRDVLARVRRRDGIYVDDLPLERYQGLTRGHHLELTFDAVPANERLRLVVWGWIFPTDTSINFALAQNPSLGQRPPRLELRQADGSWRTLVPWLGLPNGKRKAVVTELTGLLPPGRVRLRIATNLQIYWDAAVLAVGEPELRPLRTRLELRGADFHYRGFSRLYRESPSSPHLFDYDRVATSPPFREMAGRYTRYGPVDELLVAEDDCYVVFGAGDELSLRFATLPPPPAGWRRDYVLYSDGWVKDGDVHTVHSQTVEPRPYHGMSSYPDRPEHRFPRTEAQRECVERYQRRWVTDSRFRDGLKLKEVTNHEY